MSRWKFFQIQAVVLDIKYYRELLPYAVTYDCDIFVTCQGTGIICTEPGIISIYINTWQFCS